MTNQTTTEIAPDGNDDTWLLLQLMRRFCPHHVSHYLGMDVHDTDEIPRNLCLQPGMVITIEPGEQH